MSKIREIKITNTLTGKKEVLETLKPGKLTMYTCGPTVYGFIHIGNLRTAINADFFYRYFKSVGYDVTYVRNYTDVDDKIIDRAHAEKVTPDEISKRFIQEVERDYAVAGLLEPSHKTLVTTHISEIIAMIETIIKNGKGYVVEGEVLYSIDAFPTYGKLSKKNLDDLEAGARVEVDKRKKNPFDFSLWKPAKPGEPYWESPWGRGRPGWHIECSAMASKWLGDQIDIHHGAIDLIFPHHENEIAQSEAASGCDPFVKVWLHNAFLNFSSEKMSKSLGNIVTARDFLTQYGGEFARYMVLSVHYRSAIDYGPETLEQTWQGLHRIYEAKGKALGLMKVARAVPDLRAETLWGEFVATVEKAKTEMGEHLANDFNTPGALASLFTVIRDFNRTLAEPQAAATPSATLGAQALIGLIEGEVGGLFGFGRQLPDKIMDDLTRIRAAWAKASGANVISAEEIEKLISDRLDARKAKNFARADEIRKELDSRGVIIKDGPQGTTWNYK